MDTLTEKVQGVFDRLGQAFLVAGYLPAALFVVIHQIYLLPHWLGHSITLVQIDPAQSPELIYLVDQVITLLLLPAFLGVFLMALNLPIIRLYEGAYSWQRKFLLWPWQRRNRHRSEELYGQLLKFKNAYTDIQVQIASLPEDTDISALEQKRASLILEIQRVHDGIVKRSSRQRLPHRSEIVRPTALGNAFAVAEEYPYDRYGMDGVLFWPRLRPLLEEPFAETLVNTKMVLDLLLNLSLLAFILGVETLIAGSLQSTPDWTMVGVGIGTWALSYLCYRGALNTVYSLADTIVLCFDYFRGLILEQFGISQPDNIEAEQVVWLRLEQFLRRGEGFYYPHQKPASAKEDEKQSAKSLSIGVWIRNILGKLFTNY